MTSPARRLTLEPRRVGGQQDPKSAHRPARLGSSREIEASRDRLSLALGRCAERKRVVLALMLFERLSPVEAATALGVSVERLQSTLRDTLEGLRAAALGLASFSTADSRPRRVASRMRRAS